MSALIRGPSPPLTSFCCALPPGRCQRRSMTGSLRGWSRIGSLLKQAALDASGDFFHAWLFVSCIGTVG